jgi:regulator of sigma E protease
METLISIIVALLFLSLIVLVHELGHFLVAILSKVKVEIFSIGFGPRIWGFKTGDVDFRISAIPVRWICENER